MSDLYGTLGCVNDYGECVVRTKILLILILYTLQFVAAVCGVLVGGGSREREKTHTHTTHKEISMKIALSLSFLSLSLTHIM